MTSLHLSPHLSLNVLNSKREFASTQLKRPSSALVLHTTPQVGPWDFRVWASRPQQGFAHVIVCRGESQVGYENLTNSPKFTCVRQTLKKRIRVVLSQPAILAQEQVLLRQTPPLCTQPHEGHSEPYSPSGEQRTIRFTWTKCRIVLVSYHEPLALLLGNTTGYQSTSLIFIQTAWISTTLLKSTSCRTA